MRQTSNFSPHCAASEKESTLASPVGGRVRARVGMGVGVGLRLRLRLRLRVRARVRVWVRVRARVRVRVRARVRVRGRARVRVLTRRRRCAWTAWRRGPHARKSRSCSAADRRTRRCRTPG